LPNLLTGLLGGVKDAVPFRVFAKSIAFANGKIGGNSKQESKYEGQDF
jgi:hypothetical protein